MKNSILSKKINITLICVLAFIYLGCASVSILGIDSTNFYYKNQFDSVEILSAVIFIVSIIIGLKDIRLYVVFMVFNILALPSSVDNFAPSILISAYTDLRQVYFPIITHTDIYLLLGIIKFWDRYSNRTLNFKGFQLKFFFGLLLFLTISITGNIVKHVNLYDTGLILSHSYHLRYLLLLTLLFGNTPIINYRKQMFMGCIAAVVFMSFIYC